MNSTQAYELITIDLDGTLVDSLIDIHAAINHMESLLSRPLSSMEDVRLWVGHGIDRLVHRALTHTQEDNADTALFELARSHFHTAYEDINGTLSAVYPGVQEGLDWLASRDIPLIMVTNKASRFANPLLDKVGLGHYFAHRIAGDDAPAKKPDPAPLLLAAHLVKAQPDRSLMLGDSVSDIRAARAAGFASISVRYGYNHGTPIDSPANEWQSDAVIDSFAELPTVLKGLLSG